MNTDMEKNKWEEYRMQHEKAEAQAKAKLLEAKRKLKLFSYRAPLTELKILERYKIEYRKCMYRCESLSYSQAPSQWVK